MAAGKNLTNYDSDVLITGTAYADTIKNGYYYWNDANHFVAIDGGNKLSINGGKGNDYIYNEGVNVSINGGAGNDSIYSDEDGANVTIDGGAGNDTIENDTDNGSTDGGDGDDYITTYFNSKVTVNGGAGDDYIYTESADSSIYGGAGNDIITNSGSFLESEGKTTFYSGKNSTLNGGAGNDYILNYGIASVKVLGGTGNDTLINYGSYTKDVTLNGGAGNDLINLSSYTENLIEYTAGDGKDLVEGFNDTSTLSIGGAKYTSAMSGDDLIFTVGKGKITLQGAATLSTVNIIGDEVSTLKTVTNSTKSPVTIDASIKIVDASKRTKAVRITGNKLANSIVGGSKADTLGGGGGNDTLTGGKGKDLFVYTAGKDVISDYASGDKISIGGAISKASVNGDNVIFTVGKGSLTVNNAVDKSLAIIDSKGKSYSATVGNSMAVTLTNSTASPVTLDAAIKSVDASKRTKAVQITGNKLANSIVGGKSNDTLAGGKGSDTFIYDAGDGKDVIYGFGNNDLLQISGDVTASYNRSKNSVAFKVGKGSVTLCDFGSTTIFHVNDTTYQLSGGKLTAK